MGVWILAAVVTAIIVLAQLILSLSLVVLGTM
jgi:hypothetical protein